LTLSPSIAISLGLFLCFALVWFYYRRQPKRDPFIEALQERYRIDDATSIDTPLKLRVYAWKRAGFFSSPWIHGYHKIGVDEDFLYLTSMGMFWEAGPTARIPLCDLSLVGTKFFWIPLLSFDVYDINGVPTGQLLLPVSFLAGEV
jgi:hypothetical protein